MQKKDIDKEIKILEEKANFKLTEEEKDKFSKDLLNFRNSFKQLEEIDLTNIEEADFPFEINQNFLREDESIEKIKTDYLLKNSKNIKDNFFYLKEERK